MFEDKYAALQIAWLPSAKADIIQVSDDIVVSFQGIRIDDHFGLKSVRPIPQPHVRKVGLGLRHGYHKINRRTKAVVYDFGYRNKYLDPDRISAAAGYVPTEKYYAICKDPILVFDDKRYFMDSVLHSMYALVAVHIRD